MKHRSLIWLSAILLLLSALLIGCGENTPSLGELLIPSTDSNGYTYRSVAVRDYEPCYDMKLPIYMKSTEIGENTYQFHPDVKEADRDRFIKSHESLLALLAEERGKEVKNYTFRVFDVYTTRSASEEKAAYYGIDDMNSWRQVLATVQMIYGDYTTYGYMYAMADSLTRELNWKADKILSSKSENAFTDAPYLLTLTYPCFIARYATNTQTNAAVNLSLDIYKKMEDPYAGEYAFVNMVKAYAEEKGYEYPEAKFSFTPGGDYFVMKIKLKQVDIIIDSTFEYDIYSSEYYVYDDWEESVTKLYEKLTAIEKELNTVKKECGGEPEERLTIQLSHDVKENASDEFLDYVYVSHDDDYYRMLTISINYTSEIYALFALDTVADYDSLNSWCSVLLNYYLARESIADMVRGAWWPDELDGHEYYVGHSLRDTDGMFKYFEYLVCTSELTPSEQIYGEYIYWDALAFAGHLVEKYGQRDFINIMLHPSRAKEYTGHIVDQLVIEWENYIYDNALELYPAAFDTYQVYLPTTTEKVWPDGYKEIKNGYNTYRFDPSITSEERTEIIRQQNLICDLIEPSSKHFSTCHLYVTVESDPRSYDSSLMAFYGKEDAGTWKQILATLGIYYGDFTNYGYMYALADHIAAELGFERDVGGEYDPSVFADNPMLLSLTSPCFHPQYSTEAEIATAKALSIEILSQMSNPFAGDKEFTALVNSYAETLNVGYAPTYLLFAYNGRTCPVKIKTNNLEIFIDFTYVFDDYYESGWVEENWLESITSIVRTLEEKDAEITEANEFFGYNPEFLLTTWLKDDVIMKYPDGYEESIFGAYSNHYVYTELCSIDSIVHEYVHHIDNMIGNYCPEEDWTGEALAYYYTRESSFADALYTMTLEDENFYKYYQGTTLETIEDFIVSRDLVVFSWYPEHTPENELYSDYAQGVNTISIAAYIVRNWGEEAFYDVMLDPYSAEEVLGKPLSEVVANWSEYILKDLKEIYPRLKEY